MLRVTAMRVMIPEASVAEFETQAKEQLRRVTENEPETAQYGFFRRPSEGSTILPAPRAGVQEYFHFMAYLTQEGWDKHFGDEQEWWSPTFGKLREGIMGERFDPEDIVAGISRDYVWSNTSVHRFAFHRFKIAAERAAEFESEATRQVESVRDNEPGTLLYTFFRRKPVAGGLLPRPVDGQAEYFHYMAYESEAAQVHHRELEHRTEGWAWGPVFRSFIVAPLENESYDSSAVVAAVTRAADWRA